LQAVAELQLRHGDVHDTQVLLLDRKLETPHVEHTEGLFVEQVAQEEKHLVQFKVPTIFT
jgi:hypothetical protein